MFSSIQSHLIHWNGVNVSYLVFTLDAFFTPANHRPRKSFRREARVHSGFAFVECVITHLICIHDWLSLSYFGIVLFSLISLNPPPLPTLSLSHEADSTLAFSAVLRNPSITEAQHVTSFEGKERWCHLESTFNPVLSKNSTLVYSLQCFNFWDYLFLDY